MTAAAREAPWPVGMNSQTHRASLHIEQSGTLAIIAHPDVGDRRRPISFANGGFGQQRLHDSDGMSDELAESG